MALIDIDYWNQQMTTLGLKDSFTPKAEALSTLIEEASEYIQMECGRKFGEQPITEVMRGKGYPRLIVGQYPISSVTSAYYETDGGATGAVDVSLLRVLSTSGILEFKAPTSYEWSPNYTYTVTYALPAPVPGPIKRAVALKVVDLMAPQYQGPQARRIDLISNVQEQIILLIEPYRREYIG